MGGDEDAQVAVAVFHTVKQISGVMKMAQMMRERS